ncbi:hypothetical protein AB1N83_003918 [Pleurotus pulmonarius]
MLVSRSDVLAKLSPSDDGWGVGKADPSMGTSCARPRWISDIGLLLWPERDAQGVYEAWRRWDASGDRIAHASQVWSISLSCMSYEGTEVPTDRDTSGLEGERRLAGLHRRRHERPAGR